jgi:penicillin-insensitive murein endopeptidase
MPGPDRTFGLGRGFSTRARARSAGLALLLAGTLAALPLAAAPLPKDKPGAAVEGGVGVQRFLPAAERSGGSDAIAGLLAPPLPVPAPEDRAMRADAASAPLALVPASAASGVPARVSPDAVAKQLFGAARTPAPLAARSIGSYARGCMAGATALPVNGPAWQVMRLSRNRNWGNPELIDVLQRLATDAPALGWNGLLVGDLAQPRGGPMTSGHASHQIGLDADIWLTPMPERTLSRDERESMSAVSMLKGPSNLKGADRGVDPAKWTNSRARLIRRAAQDPRVARIFVHPGIKQALCRFETGSDRSWLRKVRPWWGHHYHFHVRIACPAGSVGCKDQNPPPPGDGCGKELAWWLSDEPWVPKKPARPAKPSKPAKKKEIRMSALPAACTQVLLAR